MPPNPRQVVSNMLIARGYHIDDDFASSQDEEYMTHIVGDEDSKICVFFPKISTKVGVFTIRQYIKEMQENEVTRAIIVVKDAITAFAKQVFVEAKPLVIECFKENELFTDKTKHVLVPKHELISDEEKKELLGVYKLKESQLPKILSSDAISRYFGAKRGQVFKIIRNSETCGEYIYYRIVV